MILYLIYFIFYRILEPLAQELASTHFSKGDKNILIFFFKNIPNNTISFPREVITEDQNLYGF